MATNVTERNKALQEIIEWCENSRSTLVKFLQQTHLLGIVGTTSCNGRIRAYEDVINHCQSMLGSGSKDAGMKQDYVEIHDETKLSVVVGVALREGDQVIPETFEPVALTKCERLIGNHCVADVQINHQPPSAYKLLAEYLRFMADDLEKAAKDAK